MTKTILTAGAFALAIATSCLASARGGPGGGDCGHGALLGGRRVMRALDLTADQRQQLRTVWAAHRSTLAQLAANEKTAREALADKLLGTGTVSQQDLDALAQQESQARSALMHERLAAGLAARNVLTADQLQKAATIRAGMKQLRSQMRDLLHGPAAD